MFTSLTGTEYLKAEIACKHDKAFEKETWEERLNHFDSLDLDDPMTFKKASNPIGLRAAVHALNEGLAGKETGYMISLDACSSGLQILSLLVSCPKSFALCGGNSQQCVDSYTTIYDSMNLHGALTRKEVKNAIMTSLYGSVAMPEITFGDNVDLFYDTMEEMAPGAWDLNLGLQELWEKVPGSTYSWTMPDNFHACIETKDKEMLDFNFLGESYALKVKVNGRPEFHKGLGPNLIHSVDGMVVREMFRRCMFNIESRDRVMLALSAHWGGKSTNQLKTADDRMVNLLWDRYIETGFLSARILDHTTPANIGLTDAQVIDDMINSLPAKPFDVVSVHDCFRAHPNYGDDLRRQYNTILADINDSKLLGYLCSQVTNSLVPVKKIGKIKRETITEGNYLLA